jgi:plasmid stabilization system protein ParE
VTAIIWSPQAIRDVESIRTFIAQDSPAYSDLIAERLVAAVELSPFLNPAASFRNVRTRRSGRSSFRRIESSTDFAGASLRSQRCSEAHASFPNRSDGRPNIRLQPSTACVIMSRRG